MNGQAGMGRPEWAGRDGQVLAGAAAGSEMPLTGRAWVGRQLVFRMPCQLSTAPLSFSLDHATATKYFGSVKEHDKTMASWAPRSLKPSSSEGNGAQAAGGWLLGLACRRSRNQD